MKITDVRVRKITKEGKMKAIVSITIDDEFVVHDIKVIEGEKGLFIAMPSKKATDGAVSYTHLQWHFFPSTYPVSRQSGQSKTGSRKSAGRPAAFSSRCLSLVSLCRHSFSSDRALGSPLSIFFPWATERVATDSSSF